MDLGLEEHFFCQNNHYTGEEIYLSQILRARNDVFEDSRVEALFSIIGGSRCLNVSSVCCSVKTENYVVRQGTAFCGYEPECAGLSKL